jgi:hypothetical protein
LENGKFSSFKKKPLELIRECNLSFIFTDLYKKSSGFIHSGFESIFEIFDERNNLYKGIDNYFLINYYLGSIMAHLINDLLDLYPEEIKIENIIRDKVKKYVNDFSSFEEFKKVMKEGEGFEHFEYEMHFSNDLKKST